MKRKVYQKRTDEKVAITEEEEVQILRQRIENETPAAGVRVR
jgi:hypothetical protein